MESLLLKEDLELHEAFGIILSIETYSDYILDISELIYKSELDSERLIEVLTYHNIKKIEDIHDELLDLLIVYINLILNDHNITENEKNNVRLLKMYFKIKEGDFINKRPNEVQDVLQRQFEKLYADNIIIESESLHLVDLQGIFDLSYDQFDELKEIEIWKAVERGADISELDTARTPKVINVQNDSLGRKISQQVKDLVWNRDNGQCRECGCNERLEFDHIIPFSKGGSNTYRNVQLLCEPCNRRKSNKIG